MAAVTPKKTGRINSADRVLNMIQDNVTAVLDPLAAVPIVNGNLVTATLKAGDNAVPHLLGRAWRGWLVIDYDDATGAATLKRDGDPSPTKVIQLYTTVPFTVKLWVF
jgi:hypothetical protein